MNDRQALQTEAALCLWEAMLDARLDSTLPALSAAWDASGSHTMRHNAIALAPFALAVYDALPASIRNGAIAYDFDFIPAVLAVVNWTHAGYIAPPVADAARDVAEALADVAKPAPRVAPGPLAAMRPGDVFEARDGWRVVVDAVAGESDRFDSEAEARTHSITFGEG